jgi:hypothetical protein
VYDSILVLWTITIGSCGVGVIPAAVRCTQVDRIAFELICCNEIPNALIFGRVAVGIKGAGSPTPLVRPASYVVCVLHVSGD